VPAPRLQVVAPLYYAFVQAAPPGDGGGAEADAFWALQGVMGQLRDLFIPALDQEGPNGVHTTLKRLSETLRGADAALWGHLQGLSLDPHFYALEWLSTMFARVFPLPELLRLWDYLFASGPDLLAALTRVSLAMLVHPPVRQALLAADFAGAMHTLQDFPAVDVVELVRAAERLR